MQGTTYLIVFLLAGSADGFFGYGNPRAARLHQPSHQRPLFDPKTPPAEQSLEHKLETRSLRFGRPAKRAKVTVKSKLAHSIASAPVDWQKPLDAHPALAPTKKPPMKIAKLTRRKGRQDSRRRGAMKAKLSQEQVEAKGKAGFARANIKAMVRSMMKEGKATVKNEAADCQGRSHPPPNDVPTSPPWQTPLGESPVPINTYRHRGLVFPVVWGFYIIVTSSVSCLVESQYLISRRLRYENAYEPR